MIEIKTDDLDSEPVGAVCPEPREDSAREHLEILEDFLHSVGSSASMAEVNDALAECVEARRSVA